jgi:hypothetical protein
VNGDVSERVIQGAAEDLRRRRARPRRGARPRADLRAAGPRQDHARHIIANELGVNLRQTSGPVLERPGDLAAMLTNLQPRDVLFIDEIHRLSPSSRKCSTRRWRTTSSTS